MSAIRWWYVLLTWSITSVACRTCHSSGPFFSLWHTCVCAQKHTPGPGGDSPRRVTRAWDSCLFFGRTLLDMGWRCVTCMCRLLCLLLVWHCRFIETCLQLDYLPCLATWKLDFILAKPCRTWWRSAPRDVSDMKKLCMEVSVVVLQVPFTWDFNFTVLHMQHAHTPLFRNLP